MTRSIHIVFGGSFDPVHDGHINAALQISNALKEPVTFMPAALSPLKSQSHAETPHRLAMLQLALAPYDQLNISTKETDRGLALKPSYTIDTLQELRQQYGPNNSLIWVMGVDSFVQMPHWHQWQVLTNYAHILVVARPEHPFDHQEMSEELSSWLQDKEINDIHELSQHSHGKINFFDIAQTKASSTEVRQQLQQQRRASKTISTENLPDAVQQYITQHNLYNGS